jgi:uncharacterized membrane protein YtjA (UPF0391 family)
LWHAGRVASIARDIGAMIEALAASQARAWSLQYLPMASSEVLQMLNWAVVFFVLALVAAFFGFGGIAAGAAGIAKILFFAFLVLAAVALASNLARGRAL